MTVPTTIADLTTNEATNSPLDSETITATTRPSDYLRAHAAIIKTLAGSVTTDIAAAVSAHAAAADPHTGYALESALGTASTKNTGTTSGTVPLVGTKSPTESLAGLAELATQAEAEAGSDDTVVMTPLKSKQAIAEFGIGGGSQSWQDVRVSPGRALATTYTNNTGKPIAVTMASVHASVGHTLTLTLDGAVTVKSTTGDGIGYPTNLFFIVPHLGTYKIDSSTPSGASVQSWLELF